MKYNKFTNIKNLILFFLIHSSNLARATLEAFSNKNLHQKEPITKAGGIGTKGVLMFTERRNKINFNSTKIIFLITLILIFGVAFSEKVAADFADGDADADTTLGNVGIGLTSPGSKLDVNGTIRSNNGTDGTINFGANSMFIRTEGTDVGHLDLWDGADYFRAIEVEGSDHYVRLAPNEGKVGIGIATPTVPLHVYGTSNDVVSGSNAHMIIEGSSTNSLHLSTTTSSPFGSYIQSGGNNNIQTYQYPLLLNPIGGNVGIGETSPDSMLHITSSAAGGANISLEDTSGGANRGGYIAGSWGANGLYLDTLGADGHIYYGTNNGVTDHHHFYIDGTEVVSIDNGGNLGINVTSPSGKIDVETPEGVFALQAFRSGVTQGGIHTNEGVLSFTNPSGEGIHIPTTGNVGIGTTSPTSLLHVASGDVNFSNATDVGFFFDESQNMMGIGVTPIRKLDVNSRDETSALRIGPVEGAAYGEHIWYDSLTGAVYFDQRYNNAAGDIYFRTKTDGTPVNALFIESAGNVGIGKTDPQSPLNVRTGTDEVFWVRSNTGSVWLTSINDANDAYVPMEIDGSTLSLNGNSAGNVGIGETNPGDLLTITKSGVAGPTLALNASESGAGQWKLLAGASGNSIGAGSFGLLAPDGSEDFVIDSAGNVGIGTTSPTALLHVASGDVNFSNATTEQFFLDSSSGNVGIGVGNPTSALHIKQTGDTVSDGMFIERAGGSTARAVVSFVNGADLAIGMDDNADGTMNRESMRIDLDDTGNVGIGTTTPSGVTNFVTLNLKGTTASAGSQLVVESTDGEGFVSLYSGAGSGDNPSIIYNQDLRIGNGSKDASGYSESMRITTDGNIGIGTTSPTHLLNVDGTSNFTGTMTVEGNFVGNGQFTGSSKTKKKDITPLDKEKEEEILNTIKDLELVSFKYKTQENQTPTLGVIAKKLPR